MGWGLLHAAELLIALAVLAILLALRVPHLVRAFLLALATGIVVALLLGADVPHEVYRQIGDALNIGDPAWRPLAVGALLGAIVFGVLGLVVGARGGGVGAALGGLVLGAIMGALIGAFTAITFSWQVGIAVGVAVGLGAWTAYLAVTVARTGIDTEALMARYTPQVTIDTTKETIEWAKARMPLGPRS
jgi:hypothetical protein